MAAVERPAGAGVVELIAVAARPADQRKVAPGMIGVAAGTALVADAGMEPPPTIHEPGDFLVAFEAAGRHVFLPSAAVALGAPQRTLQILMGLGEGTR